MNDSLYSIIPRDQKFIKLSKPLKATAYYLHFKIDLITGTKDDHEFEQWLSSLEEPLIQMKNDKRIIHFFYESGFIFEKLPELCADDDMLAIDIEYSHSESINFFKINTQNIQKTLKARLRSQLKPDFKDYKLKFETGYSELKKGNFYQFNLTEKYVYQISENEDALNIIGTLWKNPEAVGRSASATYIKSLDKLFLSNSPETLFEFEHGQLTSKPIKGTVFRSSDDPKTIDQLWKSLEVDMKSQAELYMITDLIRNDLNKIDKPVVVVVKKKAMMIVPKLIHQFSEVSVKLNKLITLRKVMENVFPGGSITGAPKRRVMQFLDKLEARKRGFYCGSTLTFFDNKIRASINIRSCVVDFEKNELVYQAGGGITLLSSSEDEFLELTYKHDSFIDLLNP